MEKVSGLGIQPPEGRLNLNAASGEEDTEEMGALLLRRGDTLLIWRPPGPSPPFIEKMGGYRKRPATEEEGRK